MASLNQVTQGSLNCPVSSYQLLGVGMAALLGEPA